MCKRVTEREIGVKIPTEEILTINRGVLLRFAGQIEEVSFLDSLPLEDIEALLGSRGLPAMIQ